MAISGTWHGVARSVVLPVPAGPTSTEIRLAASSRECRHLLLSRAPLALVAPSATSTSSMRASDSAQKLVDLVPSSLESLFHPLSNQPHCRAEPVELECGRAVVELSRLDQRQELAGHDAERVGPVDTSDRAASPGSPE